MGQTHSTELIFSDVLKTKTWTNVAKESCKIKKYNTEKSSIKMSAIAPCLMPIYIQ